MDRQPGLDVVRTAAISLVLLRHGWVALAGYGEADSAIANLATNGWLGVDLFFALSGFLVARSFLNRDDARDFLLHRIARIVPAYFFCLLLIYAAPAIFAHDPSMVTGLEVFEHVFFFNDYTGSDLIVAFWSLAVEMKFYALVALVFVALRGRTPTTTALVLAGLAIASIAARITASIAMGDGVDYLIYFHDLRSPMHVSLDALFLGAAAGTLSLAPPPSPRSALVMCGLGATGMLVLLTARPWMIAPGVFEVAAVPGAAAIFATLLVAGAAQSRRIPGSAAFKRAAELAFAVYLVHMSTIPWSKGVMDVVHGSPAAFTLFYLCSTLMLAGLLHWGIERPARRYLLERFGRSPQGTAPAS